MGKQQADALYSTLDKELTSLELRAALATNSKTAARQGVNDSVMAETGPGVLNRLAQIDPLHPNKLIVESLTGTSDAARQLRASGIYDEIANVLLTKKRHRCQTGAGIDRPRPQGPAAHRRAGAAYWSGCWDVGSDWGSSIRDASPSAVNRWHMTIR